MVKFAVLTTNLPQEMVQKHEEPQDSKRPNYSSATSISLTGHSETHSCFMITHTTYRKQTHILITCMMPIKNSTLKLDNSYNYYGPHK
jgi:hypothetical protein